MTFDPEICRSLLSFRAGNERFLNSALRGSADVIQIDLEDAIAPERKEEARGVARSAVEEIDGGSRVAAVRVNVGTILLAKDLDAVVYPGLAALTIPKVDSGAMLASIDSAVTKLEADRGLLSGGIRLIAQIESARGIPQRS